MNDQWGVGNRAKDKAFAKTFVGDQVVELIHGEHPHSRCDNTTYARFPSGRIEGFDGHRLLHDIRFRDYNYLKQSGLSGDEVRKGGECTIFINGKQVDSFFYREYEHAMDEAKRRIARIHEFTISLWEEDAEKKLIGRKVYYREFPAIIKWYFADQAAIILLPDHPEGKLFPIPCFCKEDGDDIDEGRESVKEDIFSPHIWWWRK